MTSLLPTDALRALPIFPLPNAVLLPRSLVPLVVFEPRYVAMTRAVLAGDGLMAIARLAPGYEPLYQGRPPVLPTIGVGRVIAAEEADVDRYHILLAGLGRATIERELPPTRIYREVEARALVDQPTDPALLKGRIGQLVALCDRLADVLPAGGSELRQLVRVDGVDGGTFDRVAGLLVTDVDQRQALLEDAAPLSRADALIEHASGLLIAMARPSGPLN